MHIQRDGKRGGCFYLASNMCLLDFSDLDVVLRSNNFKLFIFLILLLLYSIQVIG